MAEDIAGLFLTFSQDRLQLYASRIDDCLNRLSDEQVWMRGSENENAIGNLVLHLCGNIRQWIGTGVMNQQDVRDRYAEFEAQGGRSKRELQTLLEATISQTLDAIRNLPHERLGQPVTVQKTNTTVLQAIYAVVEHFSHHTGQIIFATKMLTASDLGYYKQLNRPRKG